jgi:hypothetical protein
MCHERSLENRRAKRYEMRAREDPDAVGANRWAIYVELVMRTKLPMKSRQELGFFADKGRGSGSNSLARIRDPGGSLFP